MPRYYKAKFSFDEGPEWEGWTDGKTWNGWGTPFFDRATAEKVVKWMKKAGMIESWKWKGDVLWTEMEGADPEDWEADVISTPEGDKKVWGVGRRAWTWWASKPIWWMEEEEDGEDEVDEDLLETINASRRAMGMRPLDPEASGWSAKDVQKEAARLRRHNPLKERLLR
jgi:hypothetical protein